MAPAAQSKPWRDFLLVLAIVGGTLGYTHRAQLLPLLPFPLPGLVSDAPIPDKGERWLIVENTAERDGLPAGQFAIVDGGWETILGPRCVKDKDGNPACRRWGERGPKADLSAEDPIIQKLAAKFNETKDIELPWLIGGDGVRGFNGKLPESLEELAKLAAEKCGKKP